MEFDLAFFYLYDVISNLNDLICVTQYDGLLYEKETDSIGSSYPYHHKKILTLDFLVDFKVDRKEKKNRFRFV